MPSLHRILLAVLAGALGWCLTALSSVDNLEERSVDWRMRSTRPPKVGDRGAAVILVDDDCLEGIVCRSPMPRSILAGAIDICREGGVKLIGLDFFLQDRTEEDDEAKLEASLRQGPPTILVAGLRVNHAAGGDVTRQLVDRPNDRFVRAAAGLGLADTTFDNRDKVVRRCRPFHPTAEGPVANLDIALILALDGEKPGASGTYQDLAPYAKAMPPAWPVTEPFRISFFGPPSTSVSGKPGIPAFRVSDLRKKSPAELKDLLHDRIVIIGSGLEDDPDRVHTPYHNSRKFGFPLTFGAEVHANILNTMLRGKSLRSLDSPIVLVICVTLALLLFLIETRVRISFVVLGVVALIGAYLMGTVVVFEGMDLVLPILAPIATAVVALILSQAYRAITEGRQKRFIRGAFERFVSPGYVELLVNRPDLLKLGGEERDVTIMFSDLEGFTNVSEKLKPTELVGILNQYHDGMAKLIHKNGGTVSQYGGDSIYAFWNAPISQEDHAKRSIGTSLQLVQFVRDLSRKLQEQGIPSLNARIGVNSGPAVVGNIGSEICFNYTAIGDTTNLASRIEGINKQYRTSVLISPTTRALAPDDFVYREIDLIRVKGRNEPLAVFEVIAPVGAPLPASKQEFLARFQEGVLAYRERQGEKALAAFTRCHELEPGDHSTGMYLERCQKLLQLAPDAPWDPVFTFTTK